MPLTTVKSRLACCSLVPFLLAACSNSDDPPPPAPVAPPVQITPDNARDVARLAVAAAFSLSDVARIEADLVAPGLDPLGVTLPALLLPVQVTETRPGPEGGEVIQTWDDADADMEVSTGDSFLHTFAAYGRYGLVLDGAMTVDDMDVSGQPLAGSVWTVRGRMGFLNLSVTTGTTTQVLNGSLRFVRERRPTVTILTLELDQGFEVGGASLQPGNTIGYNVYPFSFEFARFAKGAALSDTIEGLVEFDAVVPFSGLVFLPAPWGGRMEVYGADDALITIRIPDFGTTVIIEVDFDGDGVIDDTVTTTWPTL